MSNKPRVQINADTPSETITRAAAKETVVTDARGRVITLRKPAMLKQYRIVEALGETAMNQAYMNMISPLLFVAAIDGESVVTDSKLEIEALIQRLDEDGVEAVMTAVLEMSTDAAESDSALKK